MENNELMHHGIKGQKWGIRRTPKQLGHKTSTKKPSLTERFKEKKKLKAKQQAAENARKAKQEKEAYEAEKKKAIESGTAEDVLKFKGKLTNQELQTAVNRINMESQLSQISAKTKKSGLDKVSSFMDSVDKARNATEKGINAWNTVAKINNSLSDKKMTVIDGNKKSAAESAAESALDKLVKSGTPKQVSKNFGKFTTKQLEDISKRMNYEDAIRRRLNEE